MVNPRQGFLVVILVCMCMCRPQLGNAIMCLPLANGVSVHFFTDLTKLLDTDEVDGGVKDSDVQ